MSLIVIYLTSAESDTFPHTTLLDRTTWSGVRASRRVRKRLSACVRYNIFPTSADLNETKQKSEEKHTSAGKLLFRTCAIKLLNFFFACEKVTLPHRWEKYYTFRIQNSAKKCPFRTLVRKNSFVFLLQSFFQCYRTRMDE